MHFLRVAANVAHYFAANVISYLYEGALTVFSPSHDEYPTTGVQPFTGEPYSEWVSTSDYPPK
jgi:hypothetical protein